MVITFCIYLILIFIIAYLAWRKTKTLSDYILGSRQLGSWTTAISAGASDMSGWLLLGLPGYAYLAGLEAIWIALGLLIGTICNWYLIAPRLRVQTEQLNNAITLPEYFEHRFQDKTHSLRIISAVIILLFYLFYTSSGLVAGGKLFNAVFDIPYHWAVIIGASIILLYTTLGGFLAVSWTDLLQGLLMLFALSCVSILAVVKIGGMDILAQSIASKATYLVNPFQSSEAKTLGFIGLISLLGWGLGYFGQPHILIRFMAIKSERLIPNSRRIAICWTAIGLTTAVIIGLAGIPLLTVTLTASASETVFIELLSLLMHPLLAGICLAAILAAIMSTADSQLLVASSALTEDMYQLINRNVSETSLVFIGRLAVVVITLIATGIAMNPESSVLNMVAYAWAGFGAAFGPVILLSLYWRALSYQAALAGMLAGGITVIIWKNLASETGIMSVYELVPGFIISLIIISIVQLTLNKDN